MSIEERINQFVGKWIRDLHPYKAEVAQGLIKLDAMENPYSLPQEIRDSWIEVLSKVEVNRYPDPEAKELRSSLVKSVGLEGDVEVLLGNGSDEIIHMLCVAFAQKGNGAMLCPEPTFSVYKIAAEALGMKYVGVPLRPEDFSLDADAMIAAIKKHTPSIIFLASPNNPTANLLDAGVLAEICRNSPGLVILDEAYYRFSGESRVKDVTEIENLVVMHTLSKIGLAGLRIGALFGAYEWIDILNRVRMPYNIGALSQAAAIFALKHEKEFSKQIDFLVKSRDTLYKELLSISQIKVWPSQTNFLLVRLPPDSADNVFSEMKNSGLLVKNLNGAHCSLKDCIRVTVGTDSQNEQFAKVLSNATF